jgi:general secretion pathway protein N
MSALRPSRHQLVPALLLALCLGLVGVIYIEVDQPPIDPASAAPRQLPEAIAAVADAPGFTMPPLRGYTEVLERPLFSETRRPSVDSPAAPVDPRSSAFNLVGTIITSHEHRALIEHGQPPKLERVAEGQDIDGWSVESIRPDRVILTRADARLEVRVKDEPGAPAPMNPQRRPPVNANNGNVPNIVDPATGTITMQAGINLTGTDQQQPPQQPIVVPRSRRQQR